MFGPPPAYSEAVSSNGPNNNNIGRRSTSANAADPIWTVPIPPDIGEIAPPPSYADSIRSNPCNSNGSDTARRQHHSSRRRTSHSPLCARHLHRCPSSTRHNHQGRNSSRNNQNLVFPTPTESTNARNSRDLENLAVPAETRVWADRFRDLFLSILMRVLLIFLFVVFMRILIAQLTPNED